MCGQRHTPSVPVSMVFVPTVFIRIALIFCVARSFFRSIASVQLLELHMEWICRIKKSGIFCACVLAHGVFLSLRGILLPLTAVSFLPWCCTTSAAESRSVIACITPSPLAERRREFDVLNERHIPICFFYNSQGRTVCGLGGVPVAWLSATSR